MSLKPINLFSIKTKGGGHKPRPSFFVILLTNVHSCSNGKNLRARELLIRNFE